MRSRAGGRSVWLLRLNSRAMNAGRGAFIPLPGKLPCRICLFSSQRRNEVRRWYTAMPQHIHGAIAWWRKASCAAGSNSLIMRPANAAKRCRVALPPSRGATAQDGAPDDDHFQVRKAAAFACGLLPGSQSRRMLRALSGQSEATLEGAVGEIVTLIIRTRATLFRIAQGRPQPCNPPGRNDFERCSVHLVLPLDRFSPTMQGRKWLHRRFPLICCRTPPAIAVAAADR
jgi:hypothetical protein